jgi:hypothetical protein
MKYSAVELCMKYSAVELCMKYSAVELCMKYSAVELCMNYSTVELHLSGLLGQQPSRKEWNYTFTPPLGFYGLSGVKFTFTHV